MIFKLRIIAQSQTEAERADHFLRAQLGRAVWTEPAKQGREGEYLVYGTVELPDSDDILYEVPE